jgi:uncharacterized protein YukE
VTRLRVDLAGLAELVDRMAVVSAHLARVRKDVAARTAGVEWSGRAAERHADAAARWAAGAAEVDAALASLRRAVSTAHENYVAAASANRRMWSR